MSNRCTTMRRLCVVATTCLVTTTATAQISVTANGPYVATPSWSQKLTKNRFVVLADWNHEAVLDRETGLVWERNPKLEGSNWDVAVEQCALQPTAGGRFGWRLPTLPELLTLTVPGINARPALPAGHPFGNVEGAPGRFWTASLHSYLASTAWTLAPEDAGQPGSVGFGHVPSDEHRRWCVRGGVGANTH
jgi:hypothetical protein